MFQTYAPSDRVSKLRIVPREVDHQSHNVVKVEQQAMHPWFSIEAGHAVSRPREQQRAVMTETHTETAHPDV